MAPHYRLRIFRGAWAVVWSERGRTRRASLRTRDRPEAERRFADWRRSLARIGPTVGAIAEAYLTEKSERASAPAMRAAWANLAPAFANLRPDQVGRDACRRYAVGRQAQGRSAGTIIKELAMLRAALRWQDRASPAAIETPPAPAPRERFLTRAEYASLAEAARTVPHLATFVALALATAGRAGALLELKWGQVDFARGLVDLRDPARTARGAAAKGRAVVPMNAMLRTALEDARRSARTAFVVEYADRPVRSVKRAFAAACMRARLEGVTPHTLRHTAAVWMAQGGRLMPEIAQYLGHGDDRITQRVYARYSPDYLRAAARALEAG